MFSQTTGARNSAFGIQALYSNTTGNDNTAIGRVALNANTASANTALGSGALYANTTGQYNSASGQGAMQSNTTGSYNTAHGASALLSNTTASNNTAVGYQAAYTQAGANDQYNTAIGYKALYLANGSAYGYNTALGYQAGYGITTGYSNIAIGDNAMGTTGNTGTYNLAVGSASMNAAVTGNSNVGLGETSLNALTSGNYNVAVGRQSLKLNTTGSLNTAVGYYAGYGLTTGGNNVCIGGYAGYYIAAWSSGSNCIYIGYQAGSSSGSVSNEIVLGTSVQGAGANTTTLGNSSTTTTLIPGGNLLLGTTSVINAGKISISAALYTTSTGISIQNTQTTYGSSTSFAVFVNSGGATAGNIYQSAGTTVNYNTSSDARLKQEIGVAVDTSVIDNTIVHDFTWKADGRVDRGVFAQEAYEVKPSAVGVGKDDLTESGELVQPWSVDYSKYVPDLIVHAQQLKKQVEQLSAQVTELQAKLKAAGVAGF
jgi:hypothetical protein